MRKQYVFRPNGDCYDAWDVDHLVELSRALPITEVPLDDIPELDEAYWFNERTGPATTREVVMHFRLMEETDLRYPVIFDFNGRVMDGMHRIAKALMLGHDSVTGRRFSAAIEPDYVGVLPGDLSYDETSAGGASTREGQGALDASTAPVDRGAGAANTGAPSICSRCGGQDPMCHICGEPEFCPTCGTVVEPLEGGAAPFDPVGYGPRVRMMRARPDDTHECDDA